MAKTVKKTETKEVVKIEELIERIKKARIELASLQMDNQMRKLKNTSLLSIKRAEIARLLTAKRKIEMEGKK